jgi:hypothetical protein
MAVAMALVLGVIAPSSSQACPMCFVGSDRVRIAIFRMTIVMSLLPLGMIGTGVWWLRRGGRSFLSDEFEDRDAYTPQAESVEGEEPESA